MLEAAFWGLISASALVIGAEIAFAFKLSRMTIGLIMAFGVGTLISSIAFELVEPSLALADGWVVAAAIGVGAVVFFLGDRAIARMGGSGRKNADGAEEGDESGDSGMGIALGSALDGIPESAALGMSIAATGGVSIALLAAIWISNLPESLGSSVGMIKAGRPRNWVRGLWWSIALVCTASSAIGFWVITNVDPATGAVVQAFAAGALLTMIADEMAPEAFGKSALYTGLATTAGFILAVFLGTLE